MCWHWGIERHISFPDYSISCVGMDLQDSALTSAEFEDLNGGCPEVNASQPRPSYLLPLNPNKDPWSWYQRTLTFQVSDYCRSAAKLVQYPHISHQQGPLFLLSFLSCKGDCSATGNTRAWQRQAIRRECLRWH